MNEYEVTWYPNINEPGNDHYHAVVLDANRRDLAPCEIHIDSINPIGGQPGDLVGWVVRYTTTPIPEAT